MTRVALRCTQERKRKQGRPKSTWRRTVEAKMKEKGISKKQRDGRNLSLPLGAFGHN